MAGAVLAVSFGEVPAQRRALVAISCAVMLAGAAAALVRSAAAETIAWRGFVADPWAALLALGAIAAIVAGVARAGSRAGAGTKEAALFVAAAAGVAPLVVPSIHLLSVTLPLSTLAFACAALAGARPDAVGIGARRAVAALAASDLMILIALGTAISDGTDLPPELSVAAGGLLLAGVAFRVGLTPAGWGTSEALKADPLLGAVWLGPVRAQGLLLLPAAVAAGGGVGYAAAAAASATVVLAAVRMLREPGIGPAATAGVALATIGFAFGGAAGTWGAVLCVAASFAVIAAWFAGGAWRDAARPSLGALPAGALIAGAVLVVTAALGGALARPELLAFALPTLGATLAIVAAALSALPAREPDERGVVPSLWGALGLAAMIAIAALPARAVHGLALPVADALGVGRVLGVRPEAGIPEDLALIMAGVALVAFLIGPSSSGRSQVQASLPAPGSRALPFDGWSLPGGERAWTIAGTVLIAASIGVAIRIYVEAAARGFL